MGDLDLLDDAVNPGACDERGRIDSRVRVCRAGIGKDNASFRRTTDRRNEVRFERCDGAVVDRVVARVVGGKLTKHGRHDRALAPRLVHLSRVSYAGLVAARQERGERSILRLRQHVSAAAVRKRKEIVRCHSEPEMKKPPEGG
jgi:hypothetical protein